MKNLFYAAVFFCLAAACTRGPRSLSESTGLRLSLSADSQSVELRQLPGDLAEDLAAAELSEDEWNDIFAVYEEPADDALRDVQQPLPGTYVLEGAMVRFTPAAHFVKGGRYFAQCYARRPDADAGSILKSRSLPSDNVPLETVFTIE